MIQFECLQPNDEHFQLLFRWRQDPELLQFSHHNKPPTLFSFKKTFQGYLEAVLPPLFIVQDGIRVGFLRFDAIDPHTVMISIQVEKEARGKGIAKEALSAIQPWLQSRKIRRILAEIKDGNAASLKAFKAAGFQKIRGITYEKILLQADKKPVFIIAEAGSNWHTGERKIEGALRLIEAAKEAGADAIKFQVFRAESVYVKGAGAADYLKNEKNIFDLFIDLELPYEWIPELHRACEKTGIEFMASVFSMQDFAAVNPFVKRHKLASYEISYTTLLSAMAKGGKPLLLSTGASTIDDVSWAVESYFLEGGQDLTLLQCTAKYPSPLSAMNLQVITTLQKRFSLPVGLSDHSSEPILAPIAAVALGATVVEKHFTLDKKAKGPDHPFAVDAVELKKMVQMIRATEEVLGTGEKFILPEEEELFAFCRRGIQATRLIKKGEKLILDENVAILRAGKEKRGMHPKDFRQGAQAKRDIEPDEGVMEDDWQ